MSRFFEPVDYASLQVMIAEGEIALEKAQAVNRSIIAENSGLLLAVSDAIGLMLKLASGSLA